VGFLLLRAFSGSNLVQKRLHRGVFGCNLLAQEVEFAAKKEVCAARMYKRFCT
jgi:hypothetical protein